MKNILFTVFLLLPTFLKAQIITTIAGTGTPGYLGDGGPVVSAEINQPDGIALDAGGNIYFSDWGNNCIRKINTAGTVTTIAGNGTSGYFGDGGPASAALLNQPGQLYIDASGNIYFPEAGNHVVRKISSSGMISTVAGSGIPGFSGDGLSATTARLNTPIGIAFDVPGNMYIGDFYNNRVRKVNTSGIISTYAGTGGSGFGSDGVAATTTTVYHPNYVLTDVANNLYISDNDNHRIRKVTPSGIISTFAGNGVGSFGGDGSPATAASIYFPAGLAFDAVGNFYLADYYNSRIRIVNTSGTISTYAGNGGFGYSGDGIPATAAELNYPIDVAFDHAGNLLVCDFTNNRVRRIGTCINAITSQPQNDTVFAGANAIYTVTTSMVSPMYQWQENPGTGFVNLAEVIPYTGTITNTLTIHNVNMLYDTTHYRCVVSNGISCPDTTNGAILIIKDNSGVVNINAYNEIAVYPNPVTTLLIIQSTNQLINQIRITNLLGQTVFNNNYNTDEVQVDVADLPGGLYFVKINGSEVRKFVKD